MLRLFSFIALLVAASPAFAAAVADSPRCVQELASVDRSFADAMRDLQRSGAPQARCTAWRRQIEVMQTAKDVFARCAVADARTENVNQMDGSIADFRALIDDARCP